VNRSTRALQALVVAVLATGVLGSGVIVCPVAIFAHQPCPACGLTRASRAILQLDLGGAFAIHPLVFVVLPMLGAWALLAAHAYVTTGRPSPSPRAGRIFAWALPILLAAMIALWIARFAGAFGGPMPV
jgi:hypothetical protein